MEIITATTIFLASLNAEGLLVYFYPFIAYKRFFVHDALMFFPAFAMAFFQFPCQVFDAVSFGSEQYDEVV